MIGLAGRLPAIAVLVALPILPRLVARLGAVAAIAGGCLAGAVGFLALYAFPLPWAWIGIRALDERRLRVAVVSRRDVDQHGFARGNARPCHRDLCDCIFYRLFGSVPSSCKRSGLLGSGRFSWVRQERQSRAFRSFSRDGWRPSFTTTDRGIHIRDGVGARSDGRLLSSVDLPRSVISRSFRMSALAAGLSPDAALWLLSTMTAGGVALQFPIGWLSDKVSRFTVTIALAIAFIVLAPRAADGVDDAAGGDRRGVSDRRASFSASIPSAWRSSASASAPTTSRPPMRHSW